MASTKNTPLRFEGLRCPQCEYDLSGLSESVCPECGAAFDPATLPGLLRHRRRRRWIASLAIMFLALYAPYSWLLWINYPWSEYRWLWIKMWPGLPMILPITLTSRRWLDIKPDEGAGLALMIGLSVVLWLGLSWLGARRTRLLPALASIVLTLSILNSIGLYHLFHM
jgi:hypothetical protein